MVSPSTPPPSAQAHTHARDVRAALWDVYVRAMWRYRTPDGLLARSIERTDDGWVVHGSCALNTAEMLKAAQLMAGRGLAHRFDAVPAPLGMLRRALGDARYDAAIEKGLGWVTGNNEAGSTLIDAAGGFMAESLELRPDGPPCSWDMHAYQPGRFAFTVLSNPTWISEVVR